MTGIEKITSKIEQDSATKCESIIATAQKQAKEMNAQAEAEGAKLIGQAEEKSKLKAKDMIRMAQSAAQLKANQIILGARVEAIKEALAVGAKALKNMPVDDYFNSLAALAVKHASKGHGEMRFSQSDLKRLPESFETDLNKALGDKQATVNVSMQPADITDGFILVYGDVEMNCTFDALLESGSDELKEKIAQLFFNERR
ncbi:MAG TPA: V-type ATP synthase subunit E family protein [Clostridia bacterium]|nr:V-type ATP synthase subunit E family protein [Clostridia bacterium]